MKLGKLILVVLVSLVLVGLLSPSAQADDNKVEIELKAEVVSPALVTTNDAKGISAWKATLNGRLDDLGSFDSVNVSFKWGTNSGSLNSETRSYSMSKTGAFKAKLWWLSPDTTYYFRAKAEGDGNIFYGKERKFTTKKWWHWWW